MQPAAKRDAVGLVDDAVRIEPVQLAEYAGAHQLGMERRNAVDPVRADKGEVPILTRRPSLSSISDISVKRSGSSGPVRLRGFEVTRIDRVDDFEMPREKALEQRHRPALQCFRQQSVVGVGKCLDSDSPGLVPRHVVQIDQDAHQLGDRDARMRSLSWIAAVPEAYRCCRRSGCGGARGPAARRTRKNILAEPHSRPDAVLARLENLESVFARPGAKGPQVIAFVDTARWSGSTARADQSRNGLTCRSRHPRTGYRRRPP